MSTRFRNIFLALFTLLFFIACDNNSAPDVDADVDPETLSITIGPAGEDGSVYIKIPAAIYGDSDADLDGATVDLYLNGGLVLSGVEVISLFNPAPDQIIFNISTVAEGDSLGFMTNINDGTEIYYEGTVSADGESLASLSIPNFSTSEDTEGDIEVFFDEMLSAEGNASGSSFSGDYDVTFGTLTYSSDCEASFIKSMNFFIDTSLTVDEIDALLADGQEGYESTVIVEQEDGAFSWDDTSTTSGDFVGIIESDASFTIFDGSYVDENNYIYKLYEGSFDTTALSLTGTLTAKLTLDGTRLSNGLEGSCSVSQNFEGTIVE